MMLAGATAIQVGAENLVNPFACKEIIDNLPKILELGITLLVALAQGLVQAIPKLIEKIPEIMSKLWDAIVSYYSRLFELGKELLGKIINGISSAIGGIFNVGKDLVMGLWNGIVNVKDWIIGKIKGFGNSVLKAIKGIFGVHSPSTEFEWIGKMNMVGLEQGMESMKDKVQSTIDSAFNLQPNINGNMSSTYSPQMNVIVQNNMELDPLGQVVNQIKTFSGGAKNDYNWGAGL
jgi:phage-related protein